MACLATCSSLQVSSLQCSSSSRLGALRTSAPSIAVSRRSRVARPVRAAVQDEPSSVDVKAVVEDLKTKWDEIDDKPTVLLYAGGAVATIWLSSNVVSAVNAIPVLPKILELIGFVYTGWFVYRYLLFKSSRAELADKVEELKAKIAGK